MDAWIKPRVWSLIPLAIGLNVVGGQLAQILRLPIYLDSLGTILVGLLGGALAGGLTGGISTLVIALAGNLIYAPFALVAMVVGALSGLLTDSRVLRSRFLVLAWGFLIGVVAAACSAPISAYFFDGVTGSTNDLIVIFFRALGFEEESAVFAQALLVDPLDKMLSLFLVVQLLQHMPGKTLALFRSDLGSLGFKDRSCDPMEGLVQPEKASAQSVPQFSYKTPPSSLFIEGEGLLYRLSPMIKLGLLFLVTVANIVNSDVILGLYCALFILLLLDSKILNNFAQFALYCWVPFLVSVIFVQALFNDPDSTLSLGSWQIEYSLQGIRYGAFKALRFLVFFAAVFALLHTTRHRHLGHLLTRLGVPKKIGFVVLSSLSSIAGLIRYLTVIQNAQTVRGLPPAQSLKQRFIRFVGYIIPLTQRLLQDVASRSVSLYGRGFQAEGRGTPYRPFSHQGQWVYWICFLFLALLQYADFMKGSV